MWAFVGSTATVQSTISQRACPNNRVPSQGLTAPGPRDVGYCDKSSMLLILPGDVRVRCRPVSHRVPSSPSPGPLGNARGRGGSRPTASRGRKGRRFLPQDAQWGPLPQLGTSWGPASSQGSCAYADTLGCHWRCGLQALPSHLPLGSSRWRGLPPPPRRNQRAVESCGWGGRLVWCGLLHASSSSHPPSLRVRSRDLAFRRWGGCFPAPLPTPAAPLSSLPAAPLGASTG